MSEELAILVPVLGRPHRVAPFLEAVEATTPGRPQVLFLADGGDDAELEAIDQAEDEHPGLLILLNMEGGNYAEKINRGVHVTSSALFFAGADDLEPQPGWLEAAKTAMSDGSEVIGVNDLIGRKRDH